MSSTEKVNIERYIQYFKEQGFDQENEEAALEFIDFCAAEGLSNSQQRKHLYSIKTILERFAPEDFKLETGTEKELRKIMAGVHRSEYSESNKRHLATALNKYYKFKNGGEHPKKVQFISTTKKKATNVTRDDLFTEKELKKLFRSFGSIRDKAFTKTLYESAARPGELHNCNISDIEFNEKGDFIHLKGLKNTPDRTNQLIEAGQLLREWIKSHPAGGDPQEPIDSSAPLWIKTRQKSCRNCDTGYQKHKTEGCNNYEPKKIERMKYNNYYRNFKRACKKAGIKSHRPYDFRHTRITEASKFMSHEQLCKFAGWVPGSDRAKVYVHLTNDDVNQAIREEYGLSKAKEKTKVTCKFCGHLNPEDNNECRNCKRPLNFESVDRRKELQEAVDFYNTVKGNGGVETLEKLQKLIENARRVEELTE